MSWYAHDVMVIIFATFKICYEHCHGAKRLHSAYLSQIFYFCIFKSDIKGTYFLLPMSFNKRKRVEIFEP